MIERPRPVARTLPPFVDHSARGEVLRRGPEVTRSVGGILQELMAAPLHEPLATEPPTTESLSEATLVEARLAALAARRAPAILRSEDRSIRGVALAELAPGPFPLRFELPEPVPGPPFALDLLGYNSVYRIQVSKAQLSGNVAAVPIPETLLRFQHRRSRRAEVPPGYQLVFRHPARADLQVRRTLVDVSRHGCRVEVRPEQDLVRVGDVLEEVSVQTPSGLMLSFDAEIRLILPPGNGRGATMGLRLRPRSATDAARWEQTVGNLLNPATQLGGTWSEDSWDLFEASGYFSLSGKRVAHFTPLKSAFASVIRRLDAAPQVGCQVSWPSDRGVEASLSMLKLYSGTWFGYQMAKLPGDAPDGTSGRQVLRDIHLRAYEHAQADPDIRWTLGLVQATARWSKLAHVDLPARYVHAGKACLHPFRALELQVPSRPAASLATAGVATATPAETSEFLTILGRNRPWAYREALDLVPERFDLAAVIAIWTNAGFTRERELLIAHVGGQAVAAAVVEAGDPGLHLFNLLDVVRLYELRAGGQARFSVLLDAAAAWYSLRKRSTFCCLLEDGTPACAAHLGPRDLGAGSLTVLAAELLPSFLEHISEVTAPRNATA